MPKIKIEHLIGQFHERVFPKPSQNAHPDGAFTRKFTDTDTGEVVFTGGYNHALGATDGHGYPSWATGKVHLTGYREETKNGEKFHAISCYPESSKQAAREYLGQRLVGTQPEVVDTLVNAFGAKAPRECLSNYAMLAGLLSDEPHIAESFRLERDLIQMQCAMVDYNIKPHEAKRIFEGMRAAYPDDDPISKIEENPYRILELQGGDADNDKLKIKDMFRKIDNFAREVCDISKNDPRRQTAAIHYVIEESMRRGIPDHPAGSTIFSMNAIIRRAAIEGIDESFIRDIEHDAAKAYNHGIEVMDGRIGLASYLQAERITAGKILKMLDTPADKNLHDEMTAELAKPMKFKLDPSQIEALNTLAANKVVILTGGPGTGKSTLIDKLANAADAAGMKMILAAPTGKAAKRINQTTGREAKTIHRYLAKKGGEEIAAADIVVLDESSMNDSKLMSRLVAKMNPAARLVMVGDVNQIPSVEAGQPFKDLLDSGMVPSVRLLQPHRQGENSPINDAAYDMIRGKNPSDHADGKSLIVSKLDHGAMQMAVIESVQRLLDAGYKPSDIQVLTPKRINNPDRPDEPDPLSAASLNPLLREVLNTSENRSENVEIEGAVYHVGDRVMQTVNDDDLDVVNGDMGEITGICYNDRGTCLNVRIDGEDEDKMIPREKIGNLSTAYAISIHKSQGSQFPATIMVIDQGSAGMLNKNLTYTGATRAMETLVLLHSGDALERALANASATERVTWMADGLRSVAAEKSVKNLFERAEAEYGSEDLPVTSDDAREIPVDTAVRDVEKEVRIESPDRPAHTPSIDKKSAEIASEMTDKIRAREAIQDAEQIKERERASFVRGTFTRGDREKAEDLNQANPGAGDVYLISKKAGLSPRNVDQRVTDWSTRNNNEVTAEFDEPDEMLTVQQIENRMNARYIALSQQLREALLRAQLPADLSQSDFKNLQLAVKNAGPGEIMIADLNEMNPETGNTLSPDEQLQLQQIKDAAMEFINNEQEHQDEPEQAGGRSR